VKKTPAGATIHEMVEKNDEGPIIAQKQVEFSEHNTGYDLFFL
jgi:folate-dependent phosphoribosylglycinamide formyltransferase PurN